MKHLLLIAVSTGTLTLAMIEHQCNGKQDQALWDCVDRVLREYGLVK